MYPFSGVSCSYVPLQWRIMQLCAPSVAYHAVMCPFSGVSCSYVPFQWRIMQLCALPVAYHAVMCPSSGVSCSYVPLQWRIMQLCAPPVAYHAVMWPSSGVTCSYGTRFGAGVLLQDQTSSRAELAQDKILSVKKATEVVSIRFQAELLKGRRCYVL